MALMIGFALSPAIAGRAGEAPPPPARSLRLTEPSRGKVVYDSGAAFGRASALVPVRGATEAGAVVEARAVSGTAEVVGWTEIGAASGDGGIDLALEVPKGLSWLTLEARLRDAPSVRDATASPFAVGHVLAIWGQSEIEHGVKYDGMTPPLTVDHDDRVMISWHDRATDGSGAAGRRAKWLTAADGHTSAMAALANSLTAIDPDARFAVAIQAKNGTAPNQLLNDAVADRAWADDLAVHDYVASDGAHVGAAMMSWFASPSGYARAYGRIMIAPMFGIDVDGDPVSIPGTHSYTNSGGNPDSMEFDHGWAEIYDYAHTRWVPMGPHRFEPFADMQHATLKADGGRLFKSENIEQCRQAWRDLVDNPHVAGRMSPIMVEPLAYANGEDTDGAASGGWVDGTHPADDTEDGLIEFFRLHAHAWARAAGITGWGDPVFDDAVLEASGAHLDLSSSAGPITTKRLARGEPPLPSTFDHWTDVVGFQYDGAPIHRAEIVAGKVRVYPNTGSFGPDVLDRLEFMPGMVAGSLKNPEDLDVGLYRNVAIIDVGLGDVDGVPVRPLILPATVTTTSSGGTGGGSGGTGGTTFFTRAEVQDTGLVDPAPIGAGVTGITAEMRVRIRPQSGFGYRSLLELDSRLVLAAETRDKKRQLTLSVKEPGNVKLFDGISATHVFEHGVWTTIRVSVLRDLPGGGGTARVSVDGAEVIASGPGEFASGAGPFDAGQALKALSGSVPLDVERIRIWKGAREDGELPAGTPYKVIEGDAAAANADAWKSGGDPFT